MKAFVFGLMFLLLPGAAIVGQPTSPKDPSQELDKKIKALKEQIDDLTRKQDALVKEQEALVAKKAEAARVEAEKKRKELETRRAKEVAAKKIHYVKTEIRGTLVKGQRLGQTGAWQVVINELVWTLDFGDKKDVLAAAEKLVDEGVVITGKVSTKRSGPNPYYWQGNVLPIQPGTEPGVPMPTRWPSPSSRWDINMIPYGLDQPVIIQVESITAAKD